MRNPSVLCLAASSLALAAAGPALAQTSTGSFNVQMVIAEECKVQSTTLLDFGTDGVLDTNVDSTNTLGIQCTSGTTYDIGLGVGNGTGATPAVRRMTSGANTISYSLYRDVARTLVWGETIGTNTLAGTGTGAVQSFTVYGRVPTQTTPPPATYTDIINVTVTY